jgi:sigma-E factor negative regulatory protein RseA
MAMTTNSHEQLSALLDGELPDGEVELVLRRIARDDGLKAAARRYSLIGDALRDELPAGQPADLVERVRAQLQAAPVPAAGTQGRSNRVARFGAGIAVAASVATVALVAMPGRQQEAPPPVLTASEVASPPPDQRQMIQPVYTRAAGGGPDRLTRYYVNHTEYAPSMGGRGALTRIIMIQPDPAATDEEQAQPATLVSEEHGSDR